MNKPNYKRPLLVGIFIITGLAMLVSGVFMVGSQEKLFKRKFTLKVIFNDVNGLQPGNNVWLSGVKIGTVKKIAFYNHTQVQAIISLDKLAETRICKDALARVSTDGFIGNKIVVIYGGTVEAGPVKNGDFLQSGKPGASTDDMLATLQQNNNNLLSITSNLKTVTGKIANGEGVLGGLVNDATLLNELKTTIHNLTAVSQKSGRAVSNIETITARFNNQKGLVNELFTDTALFIQLTETISNLKQSMARLKDATASASSVIDNLQLATSDLNKQNKPAGMFLHDEATAKE
jgi:phospholipid/cholesterol/gamma-HCH transport system substrate-binding protein